MSLDAISSTLNTYSKVDTKKTDDTKQKEAVASSLTKDTKIMALYLTKARAQKMTAQIRFTIRMPLYQS